MKNKKDTVEKTLVAVNEVFAEICNVLLFNGQQRISPNDLENAQSFSYYKCDGKVHGQERDVSKYWKTGNTMINIAKFGFENQTTKDKNMPLRVISYDAADYRTQLDSGKELYPVVTLVLYMGPGIWDKPRSLYDSIPVPIFLKKYVSDYKINVFSISQLTANQIDQFKTEVHGLMNYFYCKEHNIAFTGSDRPIKHKDLFLTTMEVMTGDKRFSTLYNVKAEKGKEVTMCTYLDKMINDGEARGIKKGASESKINTAINMLKKGKLDASEIADYTELPLEKVKELEKEVCVVAK